MFLLHPDRDIKSYQQCLFVLSSSTSRTRHCVFLTHILFIPCLLLLSLPHLSAVKVSPHVSPDMNCEEPERGRGERMLQRAFAQRWGSFTDDRSCMHTEAHRHDLIHTALPSLISSHLPYFISIFLWCSSDFVLNVLRLNTTADSRSCGSACKPFQLHDTYILTSESKATVHTVDGHGQNFVASIQERNTNLWFIAMSEGYHKYFNVYLITLYISSVGIGCVPRWQWNTSYHIHISCLWPDFHAGVGRRWARLYRQQGCQAGDLSSS